MPKIFHFSMNRHLGTNSWSYYYISTSHVSKYGVLVAEYVMMLYGWIVSRVHGKRLEGPYSESKVVLEFKEKGITVLATNLKNVTFLYKKKPNE